MKLLTAAALSLFIASSAHALDLWNTTRAPFNADSAQAVLQALKSGGSSKYSNVSIMADGDISIYVDLPNDRHLYARGKDLQSAIEDLALKAKKMSDGAGDVAKEMKNSGDAVGSALKPFLATQ